MNGSSALVVLICLGLLGALLVPTHALGIGESSPLHIEVGAPAQLFISPRASPGVQDVLVVPYSVALGTSNGLSGYRFVVVDREGRLVWSTASQASQSDFFTRMFTAVGLIQASSVDLPEALEWHGVTSGGGAVPDGTYEYRIEIVDSRSRIHASESRKVTVDNKVPAVHISAEELHFSPNEDGNKDLLQIRQEGTAEALWTGVIRNAFGAEVKRFTWKRVAPGAVEWDGSAQDGTLVSDGIYLYEISCVDLAGNAAQSELPGITVDTTAARVSVVADRSSFSPNGDGQADTLTFVLGVPMREEVVRWAFAVTDADGNDVRLFPGTKEIPLRLVFDGRNGQDEYLVEGNYHGALTVTYANGSAATVTSNPSSVDLTAPSAIVSVHPVVFSPNGDGYNEQLTIYQDTSEEVHWTGTIQDSESRSIRQFAWELAAPPQLPWKGRDSEGNLVADGTYTYVLSATDEAGNHGASDPVRFEKNTQETQASLSIADPYLSPNFDGQKDKLRIALGLDTEIRVERLQLAIQDFEGKTVRGVERTSALDVFEWDGMSEDGKLVDDGEYAVSLEVWYSNGNHSRHTAGPVVVDTVAPEASLAVDRHLFSPDSDGRLDTVAITHGNASSEARWTAEIFDQAGNAVRVWVWEGIPGDTVWDGADSDGESLSDGLYTYVLSSIDPAGNSARFELPGVAISTQEFSISLEVSHTHVSPNGDEIMDTLLLRTSVEAHDWIESWQLDVADSLGKNWSTQTGTSQPPEIFEIVGDTPDGIPLPEGVYVALLSVVYRNGSRPRCRSAEFTLDRTAPQATLRADRLVFSPDGDGKRDSLTITQAASDEELWIGTLVDAEGRLVVSHSWRGAVPIRVSWDGRGPDGSMVSDGTYAYQVASTDWAGNYGESNTIHFRKDTRPTSLALELSSKRSAFSPNGDGIQDTLTLVPRVGLVEGIGSYRFVIRDESAAVVSALEGEGKVPEEFEWEAGTLLEDGAYWAELEVLYTKGNQPKATSELFYVDREYPWVKVEVDRKIFSPDGDARADVVRIMHEVSEEYRWDGEIVDAEGLVLMSRSWKGQVGTFEWDGTDGNGSAVIDGEYSWRITGQDWAGNRTTAEIGGIRIDTRPTPIAIASTASAFSPNGDGYEDEIGFDLRVEQAEGIVAWEVGVLSTQPAGGGTIAAGSDAIPERVPWDGRIGGVYVGDGTYRALFVVDYEKGNRAQAVGTGHFIADVSAPRVELTVEPQLFSPDGDGVDDTLSIGMQVTDEHPLRDWELEILDPKGNLFRRYGGRGAPEARLVWDGYSQDGELVSAAEDYTLVYHVQDSLGNRTSGKHTLPVDVLVLRNGDTLKIRIASIHFPGYLADFLLVNENEVVRNLKTLDRLASILKKYEQYDIRIEGHAVEEHWYDPDRASQEEQEELLSLSSERAEAVKAALIERGVRAQRMTTHGWGGYQPIVPHSDIENRWKNRRVEFILAK